MFEILAYKGAVLSIFAASLALAGCGGGDAKSPSNRYEGDPNDSGDTSSGGSSGKATGGSSGRTGGCADRVGDSFSKCASQIYGDKKYVELIDTCKAAINNTGHTEEQRAYATGICIGLVPSALFHQGRPQEARDLLAVACKGTSEEQRTNTAARATLITMLGMSKGGDNKEKIESAVVTFAGACGIAASRVADRAVELSKE